MGTLYMVSTPVGNLEDLSPRASRVLGEVDTILAEDTRRTRKLLHHFELTTPLLSLYAHNEEARTEEVLSRLREGKALALVSDAGTPLVSDPGERLVRKAIDGGHAVVPIPGPSAVLHALVGSGLPTTPFSFLGFVPRKGSDRKTFLDRVRSSRETVVLFEAPGRTPALLRDLAARCGAERRAAVARELTKLHEEFQRGTLSELARYYGDEPPRGEVTVVVAPAAVGLSDAAGLRAEGEALARSLLERGLSPSRAAREVASVLEIPRNVAYDWLLELSRGLPEPE